MQKFGNFLWKIFSATMVFLFNIGVDIAKADGTTTCDGTTFPKKNLFVDDTSGSTKTQPICRAGKYLYSCGSMVIGTKWLKGMEAALSANSTCTTPDYFSYNMDDSDTTNMDNLRKFFSATDAFTYYAKTSGQTALEGTTVNPSTYKIYRDIILSTFCTDANGKFDQKNVKCEPCPNGGHVGESNVQRTNDSGYIASKILWKTWNVHTIADCYMNEFNDNTGTYIYKMPNVESNKGENCYYSDEAEGSQLIYEN